MRILFSIIGVISITSSSLQAQTIGTFNSVEPTAQTQNLVLPATHTFQRIIKTGDPLTSGGNLASTLDFSGYVPIGGSSTNGYLSISSETLPAECAILSLSLNNATKLWNVSSSGKVNFPSADLGIVRAFCAGTVTPSNHIMVCEEVAATGDNNGDGYNDDGWIIEIDPVTKTVINQDGVGGVDKLWAMGRQRHEDVAIVPDQSVAYWSADDATNGYVYKFIPTVPGNFSSGSLYVLQTTGALGTGIWQPVANTTVADRNNTPALSTAAGAYNFNRIEGLEIGPDQKVYFAATTSGSIYRFRDLGTTVDQLEIFVASTSFDVDGAGPYAPEPWGTGADNLAFDGEGNLWVLQDGDRNHIWVVGANHTAASPNVRLFATTPAGCEPTGITFSPDYKYMFLSIQHPDAANTTPQTDASSTSVIFNESTTIVIARKENLGSLILPVRFTSFSAVQKNNSVLLHWNVSPLQGQQTFDIERSADGVHFEKIAQVTTADINKTDFTYTDQEVKLTGRCWYRISEKNGDGSVHYSETKLVNYVANAGIYNVFPQPAGGTLHFGYKPMQGTEVVFSIVNGGGITVRNERNNVRQGLNSFSIDIHSLPAGVYYLIAEEAGVKQTVSFIKL